MRNFVRTLFLACTATLTASACAANLVNLQVVSRSSGLPLTTYSHLGKIYVIGNPGETYGLRLINRSGARVLAVLSVNGVNVVSGQSAAHGQSGYVLDAWASAEIKGWRKSMAEVAQFYFTPLPDSYAARTGRPANVGVIGVAAFREYVEPRPEAVPYSAQPAPPGSDAYKSRAEASRDTAEEKAAAPGRSQGRASSALRRQRESRLGTGHGEREYSRTYYTDFRRATDRPAQVVSVFYDSYANLQARGVVPRTPRYADPRPFPNGGFVPDSRS